MSYMENVTEKLRTIDDRVRALMTTKGWSQEDLIAELERLGFETSIYRVMGWCDSWKALDYPELCDIVALADVFGTSADYLLGRDEEGAK